MFLPAHNKHAICSESATFFRVCWAIVQSFFHENFLSPFFLISVFHQLSSPNQQVFFNFFHLIIFIFLRCKEKRVMEVLSHKAGWKINQDEEGKYTHMM